MFEFDKEIDTIDISMSMCTETSCSNTELLRYDDTEDMTEPNSNPNVFFRITKGLYYWNTTENSYIRMTTKIGNKKLKSIRVYFKIVNDKYAILINDNCEFNQTSVDSACKIDDLYISFGDQGSYDQFPSIKIRYGGKFFYSQSLWE